ncbi:hypothetical protein ACFQXA_24880 [Nocardiopsis composta]
MDAETLALSAEGLLDGDDESSVRAHVAECAECAAQQAALSEVSLVLSEAPVPPLPDSVARRLDEVIGAEAERRRIEGDAYPVQDEGDPDDTATQLRRAREKARAAAPGTAESNVVPFRPRRTGRWLPYIAAAAAAVFVIGGGAAVMRGFLADAPSDGAAPQEEPGGPAAIQSYQPLTAESGTSYTEAELPDQAVQVLSAAGPDVGSEAAPEGQEKSEEIGSLPAAPTPPAELSSCITGLSADAGGTSASRIWSTWPSTPPPARSRPRPGCCTTRPGAAPSRSWWSRPSAPRRTPRPRCSPGRSSTRPDRDALPGLRTGAPSGSSASLPGARAGHTVPRPQWEWPASTICW